MSFAVAPYVTAVCPSRNRERFLPQLFDSFFSQTWVDSELLILDDSDVPYNVCPHERVRYMHSASGSFKTLGEKRNAINSQALGQVIIHFDDDDWSAPNRIEDQLRHLRVANKKVVGFHDILYYREEDGKTFKYRYAGIGHYASGTSLCYTKNWWIKHPFPELRVGEDSSFVFNAKSHNELDSCDSCGRIVAVSHSGTTAAPALGQYQFPEVRRDSFPKEFLETLET